MDPARLSRLGGWLREQTIVSAWWAVGQRVHQVVAHPRNLRSGVTGWSCRQGTSNGWREEHRRRSTCRNKIMGRAGERVDTEPRMMVASFLLIWSTMQEYVLFPKSHCLQSQRWRGKRVVGGPARASNQLCRKQMCTRWEECHPDGRMSLRILLVWCPT
ncbi:hypothetical protein VTK73DRAFT_2025 [Phialemonium thermophilum]|uniref:Uncharacterized protein n=1 Tax=Phialemonium thermophilum TaxID=223376 RepID=A0ABR3VSQ3_9PEZI